jgi:hypothetical protein
MTQTVAKSSHRLIGLLSHMLKALGRACLIATARL